LLSDVHLTTPFPPSWTDNPYYNLQAALSSVTHYNFDGLLVCGDLTTTSGDPLEVGSVSDYQTVKSLLDPVRSRFHQMLLGMGNHDDETNYQKVFGKPTNLQPVPNKIVLQVDADPVRFVVLDSSDQSYGPAQLTWLQKFLKDHHDKPVIVFTHYPPDESPDGITPWNSGISLASVITGDSSHSVKAIVSGHLHRFSFDIWNGRTYLLNLPPTDPSGLPYRGPVQIQISRTQPLQMNGIGTGWVDAYFGKTSWSLTMMSLAGSPSAFPGSPYNWLP
jgi:Icc protein